MQFIYEYICLFVYMHWSSSKEEEEEEEKRREEKLERGKGTRNLIISWIV